MTVSQNQSFYAIVWREWLLDLNLDTWLWPCKIFHTKWPTHCWNFAPEFHWNANEFSISDAKQKENWSDSNDFVESATSCACTITTVPFTLQSRGDHIKCKYSDITINHTATSHSYHAKSQVGQLNCSHAEYGFSRWFFFRLIFFLLCFCCWIVLSNNTHTHFQHKQFCSFFFFYSTILQSTFEKAN